MNNENVSVCECAWGGIRQGRRKLPEGNVVTSSHVAVIVMRLCGHPLGDGTLLEVMQLESPADSSSAAGTTKYSAYLRTFVPSY